MKSAVRGIAGLACAGSLVLVAAGCGGGSAKDAKGGTGAKADGKEQSAAVGVVSRAQAAKLIDRYEKVNNRANKNSDPKLLSTVEGGAVFQQSKATFKMQKNWTAKRRAEYREPFTYVDRKYYIPRKGTADWFAMVAYSQGPDGKKGKFPGILVMEKQKGGGWKMVTATYSETKKLPRLAKDKDGFAVPVTNTAKKAGALAPDSLSDSLLDLYTEQVTPEGGFRPSKTTKWISKIPKTQNKLLNPHGAAEFSRGESTHESVYALRTRNGGSLAVFSTEVREHDRGTQLTATIHPSDKMKVYVGETSGAPAFFVDWLHISSAYIRPQGRPHLLGSEYEMTGAAAATDADGNMPGADS
ncbi:hypothetical protein [Streptomyces spirodelae]|uniref:DUF8094 domain-containing protein n=1 Tax=Streptomyces spirodelae TaxID=2812904 RepID=A0ABS3X012_9ACTN|nr:hypothetical protein [Streptomyces spirodelae]MBO8188738.1 hypothetical protein [Streptomyces spirodelae]